MLLFCLFFLCVWCCFLKCPFLIYLHLQLEEQKKWVDLIFKEHLIFRNEDHFFCGEVPDSAHCTCMQTLS